MIVFAGDGCLLMTGQEMATAAQYGLKVIWIVANNGMYGTIRMHQERDYPAQGLGNGPRQPRLRRRLPAPMAAMARWSKRMRTFLLPSNAQGRRIRSH